MRERERKRESERKREREKKEGGGGPKGNMLIACIWIEKDLLTTGSISHYFSNL